MEVKIENIREAIKIFEDALGEAALELPRQDRVSVERLRTLDQYKLAHPRGILGILYGGSTYENTSRGRTLLMKRLMLINVAPIIRFVDNSIQPSEKFTSMMPAEYVDFVIDKITGIEVFNHLPGYERKVYPIRDELIDEQDYVWKYLVTFAVPVDLIEKIN
ncbi:hypothetical protein ACSSWA_01330 [Melioribacter sp. Ez-97]|uniref:hypothetical protein n=1 Tax=unclassified Melioribacter TaxID=2627329 RepID=UPI003ED908AA